MDVRCSSLVELRYASGAIDSSLAVSLIAELYQILASYHARGLASGRLEPGSVKIDGDGMLSLDAETFSEGGGAKERVEDIRRIGAIGAYMVTHLEFEHLLKQAQLSGENVLAGFFHDYHDVGVCLTKLMSRRKVHFLTCREAMMYLRRALVDVPSGSRFYIPGCHGGASKSLLTVYQYEQVYTTFSPVDIHKSGNPILLASDGSVVCHHDTTTRILESDSSEQFTKLSVVSLPDTESDAWIPSTKDGCLQCRILEFEAVESSLALHKFTISPDIWNGEVRFRNGIEWIKATISRDGWYSKTSKFTMLLCSDGVLYLATQPASQIEEIPRFSVLTVDCGGMRELQMGPSNQSYVVGLSNAGALFAWNRSGQKKKLFQSEISNGGLMPNLSVVGDSILLESNGVVRTFDGKGLSLKSSLWVGKDDISSMHLCCKGNVLILGCRDGSVLLFNNKSGEFIGAEQLCSSTISAFKRSPLQSQDKECFFAFGEQELVTFSIEAVHD